MSLIDNTGMILKKRITDDVKCIIDSMRGDVSDEIGQILQTMNVSNSATSNSATSNDAVNEKYSKIEVLKYACSQALFALRETIVMLRLYHPGYTMNYSHLAEAHSRAGDWSIVYENILLIENALTNGNANTVGIRKMVTNTLGANSMHFLDKHYQYEMAIINYYRVIQLHSEGKEYREQVADLFVLEDDYNDMAPHFSIAMERLLMNTGTIRHRINELKNKIKNAEMYNVKSYQG
jgi:hypothetical protein